MGLFRIILPERIFKMKLQATIEMTHYLQKSIFVSKYGLFRAKSKWALICRFSRHLRCWNRGRKYAQTRKISGSGRLALLTSPLTFGDSLTDVEITDVNHLRFASCLDKFLSMCYNDNIGCVSNRTGEPSGVNKMV